MLQNLYLLNDFIYKNFFCARNIKKILLLNSLFINSFKETFVSDIILLYFTYFFTAGRYPSINSIVLRKVQGLNKKRVKNKSSRIYFSTTFTSKSDLVSVTDYSFFLPFIKTKDVFLNNFYYTNNFIWFNIKNINLLLYSYAAFLNNITYNRDNDFKFSLNNLNIYFNFYIIFNGSLSNISSRKILLYTT